MESPKKLATTKLELYCPRPTYRGQYNTLVFPNTEGNFFYLLPALPLNNCLNENKKLEGSIIWKIFMDIIIVNKNKKCQYSKKRIEIKGNGCYIYWKKLATTTQRIFRKQNPLMMTSAKNCSLAVTIDSFCNLES
jgi:hypothetical protein